MTSVRDVWIHLAEAVIKQWILDGKPLDFDPKVYALMEEVIKHRWTEENPSAFDVSKLPKCELEEIDLGFMSARKFGNG